MTLSPTTDRSDEFPCTEPASAAGSRRFVRPTAWWVAGVLTVVALVCHVRAAVAAGPLWRDEVGTATLAGMPAGERWHNLAWDSFPALYSTLLGGWMSLGGAGGNGDAWLRAFGLLSGLSVLAAAWWLAVKVWRQPPVAFAALCAVHAPIVIYGDSIRAYGLGTAAVLLCLGLFWQLQRGQRRMTAARFAVILVAAVAATHLLYQNGVLIAWFAMLAVAFTPRQRRRRVAVAVAIVAVTAGLSAVPYLLVLRRMNATADVQQFPLTWAYLGGELVRAVRPYIVGWLSAIWLAGIGLAGLVSRSRRLGPNPADAAAGGGTDAARRGGYAWAAGLGTVAFTVVYLHSVGIAVRQWHYVPLMCVAAACLDATAGAGLAYRAGRYPAVIGAGFVAVGVFASTGMMAVRHTNLDLIADVLSEQARPGDYIIVSPVFHAIPFWRYYHGATPWDPIAPIGKWGVHRRDLVREAIASADPIGPVRDRAIDTLRRGHTVWLVSEHLLTRPAHPPMLPPPSVAGWYDVFYFDGWYSQLCYALEAHANAVARVPVPPVPYVVFGYERMLLFRFDSRLPTSGPTHPATSAGGRSGGVPDRGSPTDGHAGEPR